MLQRDLRRFQRHAADRATAWPNLTDLRMHRAGIDCAGIRLFLGRLIAEKTLRRRDELFLAPRRTEIEGVPRMCGTVLRRMRVNLHATDGIGRGQGAIVFGLRMAAVVMMAVMVHVSTPWSDWSPATSQRFEAACRSSRTRSVPISTKVGLPALGRSRPFSRDHGCPTRPDCAPGKPA